MSDIKTTTKGYSDVFTGFAEKVDPKTGVITLKDGAFKAVLEHAGVTADQYKSVKEVDAGIAAGFTHAIGQKAIDAFKKNKDLTSVTASLPTTGRDAFNVEIKRNVQYTNPSTKEKVDQFGVVVLEHKVQGTRKGEFGVVKNLLKEQARAAYGGK